MPTSATAHAPTLRAAARFAPRSRKPTGAMAPTSSASTSPAARPSRSSSARSLPLLNDKTGGTTIDGYTQPGAAGQHGSVRLERHPWRVDPGHEQQPARPDLLHHERRQHHPWLRPFACLPADRDRRHRRNGQLDHRQLDRLHRDRRHPQLPGHGPAVHAAGRIEQHHRHARSRRPQRHGLRREGDLPVRPGHERQHHPEQRPVHDARAAQAQRAAPASTTTSGPRRPRSAASTPTSRTSSAPRCSTASRSRTAGTRPSRTRPTSG